MRMRHTPALLIGALAVGLCACGPADPLAARGQAVSAPAEVLDWMRRHDAPLTTVEAGHGYADLRALGPVLAGARVVALGEATHGSREFFQLKHRLLEYLVAERGFTAFTFEAGMGEGLDLDDYVQTGRGDAARAVAGLGYWPWDTEEVLALVEWLRAWNQGHEKKVHFYGMDMQVPDRAVREALAYLNRVDPPQAARFATALHSATSSYDFFAQDPDGLEALRTQAAALLSRLDAQQAVYERRSSAAEWVKVRQLARVALQAITMTLADQVGDEWDGSNLRDQAMADNVEWILSQRDTGGRTVLWAHNDHIAKEHWIPEYHNMGGHLAARLGAGYRAFGMAFDRGQFQALGYPDLRLRAFDVPSGGPDTLDGTLAQVGARFALPLRGLPATGPVADWFAGLPLMRDITAGYLDSIPDAYFYPIPVSSRYDSLLFVEQTTRARPLRYARDQITPQPVLAAAQNLDLEGESDGQPTGWFQPINNEVSGYRVDTTGLWPYAGRRSAVLHRELKRSYGRNLGTLSQKIDATPYRGKRVRLRAAVSALVGGAGRAHLFLRSGAGYDGMFDRPIVTPGWHTYDVALPISATATTITFGLVLVGEGAAALDDVSLTVE